MVSWTVEPVPGEGKTRLHLLHSGVLGNPDVVLDYKLGWAHFLFALADWVTHRRLIGSRIGKEEASAAA
jgi:hypothetical protein